VKVEGILIAILTVFFAVVTPVYWFVSHEITGTAALILTTLLGALIAFYLLMIARRMDARPEDRDDAEIAEGAGELGFFSPYSWWPLWCGASFAIAVLGIAVGWWLFIIGAGFGVVALLGFVFEYYRGEHAH
jgi:hypothetical protein